MTTEEIKNTVMKHLRIKIAVDDTYYNEVIVKLLWDDTEFSSSSELVYVD